MALSVFLMRPQLRPHGCLGKCYQRILASRKSEHGPWQIKTPPEGATIGRGSLRSRRALRDSAKNYPTCGLGDHKLNPVHIGTFREAFRLLNHPIEATAGHASEYHIERWRR